MNNKFRKDKGKANVILAGCLAALCTTATFANNFYVSVGGGIGKLTANKSSVIDVVGGSPNPALYYTHTPKDNEKLPVYSLRGGYQLKIDQMWTLDTGLAIYLYNGTQKGNIENEGKNIGSYSYKLSTTMVFLDTKLAYHNSNWEKFSRCTPWRGEAEGV